jgi:hypothetical protein
MGKRLSVKRLSILLGQRLWKEISKMISKLGSGLTTIRMEKKGLKETIFMAKKMGFGLIGTIMG